MLYNLILLTHNIEINMDNNKIKEIHSKIEKYKQHMATLRRLKQDLIDENNLAELEKCKSKILQVQGKLNELIETYKLPMVSEHAIIRYLERVKGIDINEIKNEVLTDNVKTMMEFSNNKHITVKRGDHTLVIEKTL